MKRRCVIVAGGECTESDIKVISDNDYVIAADSGLNALMRYELLPELAVGDFDSYSGELPHGIDVITLPVKKDDTDLLYAARIGAEKGFSEFLILGGYGSRPDQNFAMYETLIWIKQNCKNADVTALCGKCLVTVLTDESMTFSISDDRYISLFPFGGVAKGVSVSGADYELHDAELTPDFPIGVSNCVTGGGDVTVSVEYGSLLLFIIDKNI